jgi:anaerobic C4-dicarboxylate transporter
LSSPTGPRELLTILAIELAAKTRIIKTCVIKCQPIPALGVLTHGTKNKIITILGANWIARGTFSRKGQTWGEHFGTFLWDYYYICINQLLSLLTLLDVVRARCTWKMTGRTFWLLG